MKTPIILAAFAGGFLTLIFGVIRSFWVAYVFPPPNPKFGTFTAFSFGAIASTYAGICVAISLLATIPFYVRRVGLRSLRHLLIYSLAFVFLMTFPASPAVQGLVLVFSKLCRSLGGGDLAALTLAPLVSCLLFAFAYSVVVSYATRYFSRTN